MTDRDRLSVLLIGLAIADWLVTVVLVMAARRVRVGALTERAQISIALSVGATCVAILAGAQLARVTLQPPTGFLLLVASVIALSVPQLVWIVSFLLGRFR